MGPVPVRRLKHFSFLRFLGLISVYGLFLGAGGGVLGLRAVREGAARALDKVLDYQPSRASRVFSADGELIGEFYLQKRVVVPYDQIPTHVQNAFVAAEDNRFFEHHGIDPLGIVARRLRQL